MLIVIGLILLASGCVGSLIGCGIVRSVSRRIGFLDQPAARKVHLKPIALGGGIGFVIPFIVIVLVGCLVAWQQSVAETTWLPDVVAKYLTGIVHRTPLVIYVLGGGFVLFAMGLIDDIKGLSPGVRLFVQSGIAVSLCMLSSDLRLTAFVPFPWLTYVYTTLWIVGITNAFNLLDNMDGLSAGVAVIAAIAFTVVAVLNGQFFVAAMLLVFVGSLIGFLVYNFPPASLFMGDAGSTFIGYMLSTLTILFTFYMPGVPGQDVHPLAAMLVPLVILAVPIYDTMSVVLIRLHLKKPVFQADKNHFSHRLVALGLSHRDAVVVIYLVTLCTGLLAPLLLELRHPMMTLLIFGNVCLMLVLVWLLEHVGRHGQAKRNNQA